MADSKEQRLRAIAGLIRNEAVANQEELGERLTALGFAVTQATISRDLEQIGAIKVRRAGRQSYALPDQARGFAARDVAAVFRDWVQSVEPAGNLIVIKTPPGSAHLVGVALDASGNPAIVGTICGDDTLFVACRTAKDAAELARTLGDGSTRGSH